MLINTNLYRSMEGEPGGAPPTDEGFPFQIAEDDPPEEELKPEPTPAPSLEIDYDKLGQSMLKALQGAAQPAQPQEEDEDLSEFYNDPKTFAQKIAEQTEKRIMGQIAPMLQQNTAWMQQQLLRSDMPQEAQAHLDELLQEYGPAIGRTLPPQDLALLKDAALGRAARSGSYRVEPQRGEPVGGGSGEVRLATGVTPDDIRGLEGMLGRKLSRQELKERGYIR